MFGSCSVIYKTYLKMCGITERHKPTTVSIIYLQRVKPIYAKPIKYKNIYIFKSVILFFHKKIVIIIIHYIVLYTLSKFCFSFESLRCKDFTKFVLFPWLLYYC